MMQAKSEAYDLARRLLASETGADVGSSAALAADRICEKFFQRLADLIGFSGTSLLLERALRLAKVDYPFLGAIKVQAEDCLEGIDTVAQEQPSAEVVEALVATIGSFLWLLGSFIGQDMVLLLIGGIWPELISREAGSGPKEDEG
jgi:hypothetical protein